MVKKVHHIGIAVKNLEETLQFYKEVLGSISLLYQYDLPF